MTLVEINWNPTNRQLRQFAVICLVALPLVGWSWGGMSYVVPAGIVGLLLAVIGWVRPSAVKPVFLALTIITMPIGLVIGEVALLLLYFAVFLPIGLIFRIQKRDGLQLKQDRSANTYWRAKKPPKGPASYYRQF